MEIRQLKYFVNAATTMNFTDAARLSNVAQSTLSQQIRQLETELDVPLFHRQGKHVQLTADGKLFLVDARRILDDARQGLERLADAKAVKTGTVHIGLASGLGISALMADVLTEYNRAHPGICLHIVQTAAPRLPEMLRKHILDVAMTFTPRTVDDDLVSRPLFGTRLCAVVAEHHPLAIKDSIDIQQVVRQPLVLPSAALHIRRRFDSIAKEQNVEAHPAVEIDDLSHIIYMVRGGRWVSIVPDVATLAVRGIVRLPLQPTVLLPTSVLTLKDNYERRAVSEFLRMLSASANLLLRTKNESCDVCGETFIV